MPFPKGKSGNPDGAKPGAKQAKTVFVEMVVDGVQNALGNRAECRAFFRKLKEDHPKEFGRYIIDIAKQFTPRPIEVSGPDGGPIQTSVEVALVAASQKNQG